MEYKTIVNDEPFLRKVSKKVKQNDKDIIKDIELAKKCFKEDDNLLALALVQIGIPKKIIYLKTTDEEELFKDTRKDSEVVMINPEIIEEKGETYFWENCASCLDNMGYVKRPYSIKVRYQDINFNYHEEIVEGFKAVVFSHEYDHLLGILHIDIAEKILNMPLEERKEFRKKEENKYKIISKDGVYKHPLRKEVLS